MIKLKKLINFLLPSHVVATLRITQALFGLITTLLIIKNVTIEEQGLYYAFINLASSYVFFDLGLSGLLVQIFSRLKDNKNYFLNNIFIVQKYYLKLSFLFFIFLIPIGYFYFNTSRYSLPDKSWIQSWLFLVTTIAFSMTVNPIFSIVESIDKIKESYSIRLLALLIGTLLSWYLIFSHQYLYAPLAVPLALTIIGYTWAFKKYPYIIQFKSKHKKTNENILRDKFHASYKKTIPTYIASCLFLFTPPLISFYFNGSASSGQLSLSLVFMNMIGILSFSSITSKIPLLTRLISNNEGIKGKRIFLNEFKKTIYMNILGYFLFIMILYIFKDRSLSHRFLKIDGLCLLAIMNLINQVIFLVNIYYRAKNQEPLAKSYFFSTAGGLLIAMFYGHQLGNIGIIMSFLIPYVFFCVPEIIKSLRRII